MHLYPTRRLAFASQFTPCQPTLRANPRSDRCKVYLDHYFFLLSRQTCLGFLVKTPPANKMQLEGVWARLEIQGCFSINFVFWLCLASARLFATLSASVSILHGPAYSPAARNKMQS
ncbi:hypothetical protein NW765_009576 [Fusarium oxysporum]|nr:hypothetical protein NW765_009576 [Fusarium oxysporum]